MILTFLALAALAGLPWPRLIVLLVVAYAPAAAAVLVGVVAFRMRPIAEATAPLFCQVVAAELRAGASLRGSIGSAMQSAGVPLETDVSAMPIEALAGAVAMRFPDIGRELQLTVRAAHRTGGRAAEVFEEVADLVRVRAEIAHEIRIATAPARATAGILVIAPCLYLAYLISSGRLESLLAGVEQRTMVLIGLGLFGAGLAAAIGVMWRAR